MCVKNDISNGLATSPAPIRSILFHIKACSIIQLLIVRRSCQKSRGKCLDGTKKTSVGTLSDESRVLTVKENASLPLVSVPY